MMMRVLFLAAAVMLCAGGSCEIRVHPGDGGDDNTVYAKLTDATLNMTIAATTADSSAQVSATITSNGRTVEFQDGQAVSVNGVDLLGPGADGKYTATVPRLAEYSIIVSEPTRGVEETRIAGPADFAITAPANGATVSLANGFAMTWTNPDPALQATVRVSQQQTGQTKVLGPAVDNGSLQVTQQDLALFGQWPGTPVKLTKTATGAATGFAGGSVKIELSQSININPGP